MLMARFHGIVIECSWLPKQDPDSKYFYVKGKEQNKETASSFSVQLPFDVPPSPYNRGGELCFSCKSRNGSKQSHFKHERAISTWFLRKSSLKLWHNGTV